MEILRNLLRLLEYSCRIFDSNVYFSLPWVKTWTRVRGLQRHRHTEHLQKNYGHMHKHVSLPVLRRRLNAPLPGLCIAISIQMSTPTISMSLWSFVGSYRFSTYKGHDLPDSAVRRVSVCVWLRIIRSIRHTSACVLVENRGLDTRNLAFPLRWDGSQT